MLLLLSLILNGVCLIAITGLMIGLIVAHLRITELRKMFLSKPTQRNNSIYCNSETTSVSSVHATSGCKGCLSIGSTKKHNYQNLSQRRSSSDVYAILPYHQEYNTLGDRVDSHSYQAMHQNHENAPELPPEREREGDNENDELGAIEENNTNEQIQDSHATNEAVVHTEASGFVVPPGSRITSSSVPDGTSRNRESHASYVDPQIALETPENAGIHPVRQHNDIGATGSETYNIMSVAALRNNYLDLLNGRDNTHQ